jgi:hypothetical protein
MKLFGKARLTKQAAKKTFLCLFLLQKRFHGFGIIHVVAFDVIEQPGNQQTVQPFANILALFEAGLIFSYALLKQLMYFFMGDKKRITCFFLQTFFEAEVRYRVIHKIANQIADFRARVTEDQCIVQLIDIFNDPAVLLIDNIDSDTQLVCPYEFSH